MERENWREERAALAKRLIGEIPGKLCEEDRLIAVYKRVEEEHTALAQECERVFMAQATAALARGDVAEARAVVGRCPDDVVKCFILDAIREHAKKGA